MTTLLSSLREPPTVGRFYMVPYVYYRWHGRREEWPVIGPLHSDAEFFAFPYLHYHVDVRFLGRRLSTFAARRAPWMYWPDDFDKRLQFVATGYPVFNFDDSVPTGRPWLKRMRCSRVGQGSPIGQSPSPGKVQISRMMARYGCPAEPLRLRDGRLLCPHQKVDLSQFTPDADGIVICPVHGLPVRCGVAEGALL